MRAFKHHHRYGFTLVELMIVVAIIGTLAALALFGMNHYLKSAKTGEARHALGRIARAAEESLAREAALSEITGFGNTSAAATHQLCDSANPVPNFIPAARKYVPNNFGGADFDGGTATRGWKCLRFELHDAIYYQYNYLRNSTTLCTTYGCAPTSQSPNFEAAAIGDLDADGVHSAFIMNGEVDATTQQLNRATVIHVHNESE